MSSDREMPKMKSTLAVLWLVCMLGCRERVFQDTLPNDFQLISINGLIHNAEGPYFVEIHETQEADRPPIPVGHAQVTLLDGHGNHELCLYEEDGKYACPGISVRGVPGGEYQIEVQVDGDTYTSTQEIMPGVLGTNRLEWEERPVPRTSQSGIDVEETLVVFDMFAELPEVTAPTYMVWQMYETFQIRETDFPDPFGFIPPPCFITQNIGVQNFYTLPLTEFTGSNYYLGSVIERKIDISFLVKHIFSIRQSSVTENYFNYLRNINTLTSASGSLFDPPAGRVMGNISHEGDGLEPVGYFAAVMQDTTHSVIYQAELESFILDLCIYEPFKREYPPICLDCLLVSNSTFDKPYWWDRVR